MKRDFKYLLEDKDLNKLTYIFYGFWFHWASTYDSLLSYIIVFGIATIIFFLAFRIIKRIFFNKKTIIAHKNSVK